MDIFMIAALAAAAGALVLDVAAILWDKWGRQAPPQIALESMSDTDREMARQTQELIRDCFGENLCDRMAELSKEDRIKATQNFAQRLAQLYGLDVEVDVMVDEPSKCGAYSWAARRAVFNVILLTAEADNPHFQYCVQETLDTVVHELRHAVQDRAIREKGFWDIEDDRRLAWAENMSPGHYITASTDLRAYARQPVEADAVTFAGMAMEGVF